jgi:hypothetical protein
MKNANYNNAITYTMNHKCPTMATDPCVVIIQKNSYFMGSEVLIAVVMKSSIFWDRTV